MILYKYRSYEKDTKTKDRTQEIISNKELFFSGIEAFNDPFDGKIHLRFDGKINEIQAAQIRVQYDMHLKKEKKFEGLPIEKVIELIKGKITEEYLEDPKNIQVRKARIQQMHNQKGVLSLSSKNNNILMWSHYSNNHYGVCFGFEWDEGVFSKYKKVRYQTHYDDIWLWLHTDDEIVNRILYSKSIDWQYEDEYRIVKNEIGTELFLGTNLKEIVFGCMMSEIDKVEIIELCEKNKIFPSFKQAKMDIESYTLNIVDHIP
jgi:hypothetical protein